jgi:uncharacterized protein (TIGR03435 family)
MKRALISASLSIGMIVGIAPGVTAQSGSSKRAVRADHSRLPNEVHITPTTLKAGSTSIETGGDHWSARGYDLKTLIAQIYDVDVRRIDFGNDGEADARYDVTLDLPQDVDPDAMQHILQEALGRKFHLSIKAEDRAMDVYVLSAPNGVGVALRRHSLTAEAAGLKSLVSQDSGDAGNDGMGQITFFGKDCAGVGSGGISVSGGTMSDFRRTLEADLDRILVDETHLAGSYDFKIASFGNQDALFKLLHDQLGLVVTPAQRNVRVLTVRSATEQNLRATL